MKRIWSVVVGLSAVVTVICAELATIMPLRNAHAHNDYEHTRPLLDALDHGFCGVEADIYLVGGELLVAHDLKDTKSERTLEKLYLQPLKEIVGKNRGRVYAGGPPVTLLIDIKSGADETYRVLSPLLQRYASILTRFRDNRIETNAVTVILSGNRPRQLLQNESDRYASFDGRLDDLGKELPVAFMPLVSDNFAERFPSVKQGKLSEADRTSFRDAVKRARTEGRAIRFWATKDDLATWKMLREADVDYINTDDLAGLASFLREVSGK